MLHQGSATFAAAAKPHGVVEDDYDEQPSPTEAETCAKIRAVYLASVARCADVAEPLKLAEVVAALETRPRPRLSRQEQRERAEAIRATTKRNRRGPVVYCDWGEED